MARRPRRHARCAFFLAGLGLLGVPLVTLLPASPVLATSITVNTASDTAPSGTTHDGLCTLRGAMLNALANGTTSDVDCATGLGGGFLDVIHIDGSLAGQTLTLAYTGGGANVLPLPQYYNVPGDNDLEIDGPTTNAADFTIDAANHSRIFDFGFITSFGAKVKLANLTLKRGNATNPGGGASINGDGGAIDMANGTQLTLDNVVLRDNVAGGSNGRGGAIYMDGAPSHGFNSVLTNNGGAFINNVANGTGINGRGGAIFGEEGPLTYNGYAVLFDSNSAHYAGGAIATNPGAASALLHLERALAVNNSAASGGVAYIDAGALQVGTFEIFDSTITGNHVTDSGGVFYAGNTLQTFNYTRDTILNNTGVHGGLFYARTGAIRNSIVSGSSCAYSASNQVSVSRNLGTNNSGCVSATTMADVTGLSGTLAQNGGPEVQRTYALSPGSNAIDNGDPAFCGTIDARSVPRGVDADGTRNSPQPGDCDIGSYEFAKYIVNFQTGTSSVLEGQTDHVQVKLAIPNPADSPLSSPLTVNLTRVVVPHTASAGIDYTVPTNFTVTFPTGSTNGAIQNFDVTFLLDQIAEANGEKLDLQLTSGPVGTVIAEPREHDISIQDADQAGVIINDGGNGTTISEATPNTSDSFTMSLRSRPDYCCQDPNNPDVHGAASDVTVTITPDRDCTVNLGGGVIATEAAPKSFTILNANWQTGHSMAVNAINDLYDEDFRNEATPHTCLILYTFTSPDPVYAATTDSYNVTVGDNDTAAVIIDQSGMSPSPIAEGGTTRSYKVHMATPPDPGKPIPNTPRAATRVIAHPGPQCDLGNGPGADRALTFDANNFNTDQTVVVTAVDNLTVELDHNCVITHTVSSGDPILADLSAPPVFSGTPASITAAIQDYQPPGITNDPPFVDITTTHPLAVDENTPNLADTLLVGLERQPLAGVDITFTASNGPRVPLPQVFFNNHQGVYTAHFTTQNWNSPQTISVFADHDFYDEPTTSISSFHISMGSTARGFNDPSLRRMVINAVNTGTDNGDLNVTITDADTSDITLMTPPAREITEGITSTYTVSLATHPYDDVTVTVTPSGRCMVDGGAAGAPKAYSYAAPLWNITQTVHLSVDDNMTHEITPQTCVIQNISASSGDDLYQGLERDLPYTIRDNDPDHPPVLGLEGYDTPFLKTLTVTAPGVAANDFDPDGQTFTVNTLTPTQHGQVVLDPNGGFVYHPTPGYSGPDGFYYVGVDPEGAVSHPSLVTLTVGPDGIPVAADDVGTTLEDVSVTIPVLANDHDPEPDQTVSVAEVNQPANGVTTLNPDGTVTYTPDADFSGVDTFTYLATDSWVNSAPATVTVTVVSVNDAPTFTPGPDVTVDEDSGPHAAGWATNVSPGPSEAQETTFVIDSQTNPGLFSAAPVLTQNGLAFTPAADAFGADTLAIRLVDDGGTANGGVDSSPSITFTITVKPVNDAPSFTSGPDLTVTEDSGVLTVPGWAANISRGPTNENSQTLTFEFSTTNADLFATTPTIDSAGTLAITPAIDAFGSGQVTVRLRDSGGTANGGTDVSSEHPFTFVIMSVNDAPSFTNAGDVSVVEDSGAYDMPWASNITPGPANESDQQVSLAVSGDTNPGLYSVTPAIDASTGRLTFTPATNANGDDQMTVTLQDDGGTDNGGVDHSPTITLTIHVRPVNDVPTFTPGGDVGVAVNNGPYSATWATAISRGPANESGQAISFTISSTNAPLFSSPPALSPSGILAFTPATGVAGASVVTVALHDDGGVADGGVDTSPSVTFTISVSGTGIKVTSSEDPSTYSDTLTFTAFVTVEPPGATPTGTLTFTIDGGFQTTAELAGAQASFSTASLPAGGHVIGAAYGGAPAIAGSFGSLSQTVQQAPTAITLTPSSATTVWGEPYVLTATVAGPPTAPIPTGTVAFFFDGAETDVALANGTAVLQTTTLSVGPHTVTATYQGAANFLASQTSVAGGHQVDRADTEVGVTPSPAVSVFGQSVTVGVHVLPVAPGAGLPSGTATVLVDGVELGTTPVLNGAGSVTSAALAVGNHEITATYSGDANFVGSAAAESAGQTVNQGATSIALNATPEPSAFGQPVTLQATVSPVAPAAGVPTGTVQLLDGGQPLGDPITMTAAAVSLDLPLLSPGPHQFGATYSGDGNFVASEGGPLAHSVGLASTTIALAAGPPVAAATQPIVMTAHVAVVAPGQGTPTGAVRFLDGGSTVTSVPLAATGVATASVIRPSGDRNLTAVYDGDNSFASSTSPAVTLHVNVPPVAADDTFVMIQGAALVRDTAHGLLANDTDAESSALTTTIVTGPNVGVLDLAPAGSFIYTPPPDFAGTVTFSYRDADGLDQSAPANATITVAGRGTTYYFAEGTVRPGFAEYIALENPGDTDSAATLHFQASDDAGQPQTVPDFGASVPAHGRTTVNVADVVGPGPHNVSVAVAAASTVVAERVMYFSADPGLGTVVDGGTVASGAQVASPTYDFAEGTARPGFVEYLTLQNPGDTPGTATVTYQAVDDNGAPVAVAPTALTLPARSRMTINVGQHLADLGINAPVNVSAHVDATVPVVAERPMYFSADPGVGQVIDGGSDVLGAPAPATVLRFAEGTVRPGYVEYLTIVNPGNGQTTANVAYLARDDSGNAVAIPGQSVLVPGHSRATVAVTTHVMATTLTPVNLSVLVSSRLPIVVERPIYFVADPGVGTVVDGGTTIMGTTAPVTRWRFAEGTVRPGYVEYLTIQNPGSATTAVLHFQAGAAIPDLPIVLPGASRVTVNVTNVVNAAGVGPVDVSLELDAATPVVAERPIYFSTDPGLGTAIDGGTTGAGASG